METLRQYGLMIFSLYQQFHLDEGFQGCIHELKVNERHVIFNSSEHHIILSAQNIGLIVFSSLKRISF